MLRKTPSLESAEAFLAAARASSFREAAESIALSPSAFTRRVQLLESFVGAPLFDRSQGRLALTTAGARYLARIEPAMEVIRGATEELRGQADRGRLRLVTSHSLAVGWLMPRLSDLFRTHGIEVDVSTGRGAHLLRSGEVDLAIWAGVPNLDDYEQTRLADLECVLASAPALADGRPPPGSIDELRGHRRLSVKAPPDGWTPWSERMSSVPAFGGTTVFETSHLMYEAAAGGMGLTLVTPMLADRFLREGRLRPCFGGAAPLGEQYRLIYADPRLRRRRDVQALGGWLAEQARDSVQTFQEWMRRAA